MLARMYWKKVVSRGEQYYQITRLENFKRIDKLPEKYTTNPPHMNAFADYFSDPSKCTLHITHMDKKTNKPTHIFIRTGSLLSKSEKENAVHWMKICGQRLASINKTLTVKNADWTGEGFDEI